jgi:hypothetical protein
MRQLVIAVAALALLLSGVASLIRGRGALPLGRSPFLRDVVEPITIVDGMAFSDGGSLGLRFQDARGVVRDICLEDTRIWEDDPGILEGHHNVILNSFFPGGERARRVPVSGDEERALLGLLDRWAQRRNIGQGGGSSRADQIALSILKEIRRRN